MPRPAQPPRLYLRERKGREARYVILDRGREIGTGFGESDQRCAEEAFGRYLADKHRPDFGDGHPSKVAVADALTYYRNLCGTIIPVPSPIMSTVCWRGWET